MSIKIKSYFIIAWICIAFDFKAQSIFQTVRGTIVDKVSQTPIRGAVVMLMNFNPVMVTTSDENGKFSLKEVPIGKQSLSVSYIGYKASNLQNLSVNAGKELVLTVNLEEDIKQMNEVEVTAKIEKNKPLNEMSTVSTRAFSVEEAQKFAAAANDHARMALAFAGVVSDPDENNNISIRGNSPNGLLWWMEYFDTQKGNIKYWYQTPLLPLLSYRLEF